MNKKAFTLMELIVVVIVIGILATIALPQYGRFIERSRMSEAINILGVIREAQIRYAVEYDVYANNMAGLGLNLSGGGSGRYFDFSPLDTGNPLDVVNQAVALATRNGIQVGGGYSNDYTVQIYENGNITSTGPEPPAQ